ncbi:uncharacterized protein A4U43_C03F14220 [Asparagus officinalis]|uniref:Uncharacterized protein n=1 Tax=Asparagus officinalis TaxID=4686 RepID=A0A5P1FAJ1_ASPOF|nr:uncharacterized protein A4U43_C03F14220 [Asparagus officinalis]
MIPMMDGIRIANEFANVFEDIKRYFALGMARLGSLGVLKGKEGEVSAHRQRLMANKTLEMGRARLLHWPSLLANGDGILIAIGGPV